jgi:hypothetical protein
MDVRETGPATPSDPHNETAEIETPKPKLRRCRSHEQAAPLPPPDPTRDTAPLIGVLNGSMHQPRTGEGSHSEVTV